MLVRVDRVAPSTSTQVHLVERLGEAAGDLTLAHRDIDHLADRPCEVRQGLDHADAGVSDGLGGVEDPLGEVAVGQG